MKTHCAGLDRLLQREFDFNDHPAAGSLPQSGGIIEPNQELGVLLRVSIRIADITDEHGQVIAPHHLDAALGVHRQLRPQLAGAYTGLMAQVFAGGGRMAVALDQDRIAGVAVYRIQVNTHLGRHLYVDDLVTDAALRSHGIGHALMAWLRDRAQQRGCTTLALDSGVQRADAHRFYFREGMTITSFNFKQPLN